MPGFWVVAPTGSTRGEKAATTSMALVGDQIATSGGVERCTVWRSPSPQGMAFRSIKMTRFVSLVGLVGSLFAAAFAPAVVQSQAPADAAALFDRGQTMEQFVQAAARQRESWIRNVAAAKIEPGMVERFRRAGSEL